MNARWYSPAPGAFTSNDTITGSPLSSTIDGNPYTYAGADPLTTTDPTGNCWLCLAPLVGLVDGTASAVAAGVGTVAAGVGTAWGATVAGLAIGRAVLGAAFWGIDAFFFPSGLQSGDCPAAGCYGRSPGGGPAAGSWSINYGITSAVPFWSTGNSGYAPCGAYCYTPVPPPPPPPPPQDCYAGPDATCTAPTASHALRYSPWITSLVHDITSASSLLRQGRGIHEQVPISTVRPSGTKFSPTTNGNPLASPGNDLDQLLKDIHDIHPALPTADLPAGTGSTASPVSGGNVTETTAPETATGGGSIGQGGGNPPASGANACEPEGPEDNPLSAPGALRDAAVRVHNLASPAARFNQSTVALAQVDVPGEAPAYYASALGGILSSAQVGLLKELGVPEINILTGLPLHAEANIYNAMFPEGTTISRWGIAWASNNNPNPCTKCAPFVKGIIEGTDNC